jgi:hypothetical protein
VDRAELPALAGAHLEEGLLEPLGEPPLLVLQIEQALGVEPLEVGGDGPRPHLRRHHVDADVLLEEERRELAEIAAGEGGLGRRGEACAGQEERREE